MDLTESIIPRSDQINADDLIAGPITYTISKVVTGKAEQPFDFVLVESDRVYRPSKTSRRVIVNAWGADTKVYAGRRLTLYREPSIVFAGQKVGGIRVSHMSDIDGPVETWAQTTRGKRERFVVQPLKDPKLAPSAPEVGPSAEDAVGSRGGGPYVGDSAPEPAFGASTNSTEGGERSTAAPESESPAPQESLKAALNRQIRSIQIDEDGGAYLRTWADSVGVAPSSGAIAEKFGEAARDLRGLMGTGVAS